MLAVLASGQLARDPQQRKSASGKPYVTGLLRVPCEGDEGLLVSVIAFDSEAVRALLALKKGDACSIAGRGKLSEWTAQDGSRKHGLSVVADRVLSAYAAGRARKASRQDAPEPEAFS